MGCAFDSFSTSWVDRSYILALMVLCWLLPSFHNLAGYIIMMKKLRKSNIFQFISPNAHQHKSKLLNSTKRVNKKVTIYMKINVHEIPAIQFQAERLNTILFDGYRLKWR